MVEVAEEMVEVVVEWVEVAVWQRLFSYPSSSAGVKSNEHRAKKKRFHSVVTGSHAVVWLIKVVLCL